MRKLLLSLIFTFICISAVNAVEFDKYFENRSLRMDVYHWGDSKTSNFILDKFVIEKYWGGSKTILLDEFNYGSYMVKVIDAQSGKTIYTRGYCTLFQEWQTTEEASKMCRCYEESVSVPMPKNNAIIEIDERNNDGVFEKVFSAEY
ncbi:MAG: peptidase M64, partial [Bacteroidales bacterium]|nr:peptidase M64 [Bacteroidales bacterium]